MTDRSKSGKRDQEPKAGPAENHIRGAGRYRVLRTLWKTTTRRVIASSAATGLCRSGPGIDDRGHQAGDLYAVAALHDTLIEPYMGDLFFEVVGRKLYKSKWHRRSSQSRLKSGRQFYHVTQPGDNARVGIGYHGKQGVWLTTCLFSSKLSVDRHWIRQGAPTLVEDINSIYIVLVLNPCVAGLWLQLFSTDQYGECLWAMDPTMMAL